MHGGTCAAVDRVEEAPATVVISLYESPSPPERTVQPFRWDAVALLVGSKLVFDSAEATLVERFHLEDHSALSLC
jgi:hypothetical protein